MTRSEFMHTLSRALLALPLEGGKALPESERAAALRYYEEYLDDAGVGPDDPVPDELGKPEALAKQIIAEAGEEATEPPAVPESRNAWPAFRSVQIDAANASIAFFLGSEYHVQIDYPDGAPGGQGVSFDNFRIETVNGSVTLPALAIENVHCETVNGEISLSGVVADRLHCEAVNGNLKLTSCYAHQSAHCENVNGGIQLGGELRGKTHAETVNGGIHIATALPITAYDLDLETVSGGVYLDGEKHRKEVHISHRAENTMHAETVNGSIKLEFSK